MRLIGGTIPTNSPVCFRELRNLWFAAAVCGAFLLFPNRVPAQQEVPAGPEAALAEALSNACRQDTAGFANFLTSDSATAYRELPGAQRTALLKRFVLLEDPGHPLRSTRADGRLALRCEAPGIATEMRLGEVRLRENLAFIPMEIPLPNEASRSTTFGLVREGGNWKLLSVGLLLLDIPSMARQWEEADFAAREDNAIASLRKLASALETYRRAYGKLPEALTALGPAPKSGISPEAGGLVDAELAAGSKDGYIFRYNLVPAAGGLPEHEADKAAGFALAATPTQYGKTGRRSFFLDSAGALRGDDKKGGVATSTDARIGPS